MRCQKSQQTNRAPVFESVESRTMLSATIDLRLPNGGKQIAATRVGQTINIEVWAVITGKNASSDDDGFQSFLGSFLSSNTLGGSVRGSFKETIRAPFNALASQTGASVDLDNDGDKDLGSNDTFDGKNLSAIRSSMITKGQLFHVADLTFTVEKLLTTKDASTQLNFRPRTKPLQGVWMEDGKAAGLGLSVGKPVVVTASVAKAPAKSPAKSAVFSTVPMTHSATLDVLK